VGDRNKITIKDMIKICVKHAHVKKCKKRKYGIMPGIQSETKIKT
jgi:hypothetical protein